MTTGFQALTCHQWLIDRISLKNPPDYKGVGLTLLSFARQRSKQLGYEGRVGLHALPKAENFYKKRGMIDFGIDTEKEDLVYFEWLKEE